MRAGYSQFCPVSMATEILCSRWTPLVIRKFLCCSTRFNDIRRGLPRMYANASIKKIERIRGGRRHRVYQGHERV